MSATSQIRQSLNPIRVRGHIRPRESMHTAHSPASSTFTAPTPTEFCTSYFFSGPSRPFDISDSPVAAAPPRHTTTTNSSPAVQPPRSGPTPILFDGPSRPRHLIPVAQMYLDDIKAGRKSKSKSESKT
ncbi:hypothetical protein OE88DRAFT_1806874 [Heliocybe sulcata]|uniref:Uncharacterized protein n=1 Tax=Heliocybe sulcata TaxID=5364 RepID=A0A5C3NHA4_9AGAM|nr:hypothetical protein OE88DRAFT_1806874 [Heliocybe sulcata]